VVKVTEAPAGAPARKGSDVPGTIIAAAPTVPDINTKPNTEAATKPAIGRMFIVYPRSCCSLELATSLEQSYDRKLTIHALARR
jgi:hypothetical protein